MKGTGGTARGMVGNRIFGCGVECELTDGNSLEGSTQGLFLRNHFQCTLSPEGDQIWGRLGGRLTGRDLNIALEPEKAWGRIGGKRIGKNVSISGTGVEPGADGKRIVQVKISKPEITCNLEVSEDGQRLTGMYGGIMGKYLGTRVFMELDGISPQMGAILAVTAYVVDTDRGTLVGLAISIITTILFPLIRMWIT